MHTMSAPTSSWQRFLRPGAIMMALGAVLVLAGVVQTTSSHFNGGNQSCPQGTTLIAKFNNDDHPYEFEKPAGNENVVTLSHTSDEGAWWSSTQPVSAIIVKGGPASVLYSIAPPQVTGSFSNQGLPDAGNSHHPPDISHVQFCGSNTPASTSTTLKATTTSSSSTTSTSTSTTCGQCQTTTTTAPHCGECETTTTHPPTTTCECTTTTYHPPTTCKCSTTTTHPQETTTTHERETTTSASEETTTTVSGSTTTSTSDVSGSTVIGSTSTTHRGGSTTVAGLGSSTSFGPTVSSTSVYSGDGGGTLPFTGSSSTPIMAIGVVLLATGLTLTLSQARRRERTQG